MTAFIFLSLGSFVEMNETEIIVELGRRLKSLRLSNSLTQTDLSFKLGTDESYIRKVEKGRVNMKFTSLLNYVNALEADLCEIIQGLV